MCLRAGAIIVKPLPQDECHETTHVISYYQQSAHKTYWPLVKNRSA